MITGGLKKLETIEDLRGQLVFSAGCQEYNREIILDEYKWILRDKKRLPRLGEIVEAITDHNIDVIRRIVDMRVSEQCDKCKSNNYMYMHPRKTGCVDCYLAWVEEYTIQEEEEANYMDVAAMAISIYSLENMAYFMNDEDLIEYDYLFGLSESKISRDMPTLVNSCDKVLLPSIMAENDDIYLSGYMAVKYYSPQQRKLIGASGGVYIGDK